VSDKPVLVGTDIEDHSVVADEIGQSVVATPI
jgi:hypothetical protein